MCNNGGVDEGIVAYICLRHIASVVTVGLSGCERRGFAGLFPLSVKTELRGSSSSTKSSTPRTNRERTANEPRTIAQSSQGHVRPSAGDLNPSSTIQTQLHHTVSLTASLEHLRLATVPTLVQYCRTPATVCDSMRMNLNRPLNSFLCRQIIQRTYFIALCNYTQLYTDLVQCHSHTVAPLSRVVAPYEHHISLKCRRFIPRIYTNFYATTL